VLRPDGAQVNVERVRSSSLVELGMDVYSSSMTW
jgi:hypothetical protein